MVFTRDFLNPIMKNVPYNTRPDGYLGAGVMAFIAAINPKSMFTQPYFGLISWFIVSWWIYNKNFFELIRSSTRRAFINGNPKWYQILKSLLFGLVLNPILMFIFYLILLVIARTEAKINF